MRASRQAPASKRMDSLESAPCTRIREQTRGQTRVARTTAPTRIDDVECRKHVGVDDAKLAHLGREG